MNRNTLQDEIQYKKVEGVILLGLLIGYLIYGMLMKAYPMGEAGTFMLHLVAITDRFGFTINEIDVSRAMALFPESSSYLQAYTDRMMQLDNGNWIPWYFGAYAYLCIPVFLILRTISLAPEYTFAITNALLLGMAIYMVYKYSKLKGNAKFLLILLLGTSPAARYIIWQSYEVAIFTFVTVAIIFWCEDRRLLSALFLSIAGSMQPAVMAFGIFMILEYFFEIFQECNYSIKSFIHTCFTRWGQILKYAACFIPCLIPIFVAKAVSGQENVTAQFLSLDGIWERFAAYWLDLNLGLLPYIPLLLVSFFLVFIFAIKNKAYKIIFSVLGAVATVLAFSIHPHLNCGMQGIARYNSFELPIIVIITFYGMDQLFCLRKKNTIALVSEVVSVIWCAGMVVTVALSPDHGNHIYWTPLAEAVLDNAPQIYNPVPSTFNSRTIHQDGGYNIQTPVVYEAKDGTVRKILVPQGQEQEVHDRLYVPMENQTFYEKELSKLEHNKEFVYLNFPTQAEALWLNYSLGQNIEFTEENKGTSYFKRGISNIETDFAWTLGKESIFQITTRPPDIDVEMEIKFKYVLGDSQQLIVKSGDMTLFDETVFPGQEAIKFVIPKEHFSNGALILEMEYPDARQPGNGDPRILAFGIKNICIKEKSA